MKQNTEQLRKEYVEFLKQELGENDNGIKVKVMFGEDVPLPIWTHIWNFFLPHLIRSDEIKREVIKEFANDILRASIKEIEWCRDNPDKAPGKSFGKGFVKGIEQVTHIIIPQLLRLFNDDLTQSKEGGE